MTLVLATSVVVSALTDSGRDGEWCRSLLGSNNLAAPHVMPIEVAKVLRRLTQAGEIDNGMATVAHSQLMGLPIVLFPYARIGDRVWELRHTVIVHDACFVALAEGLDADLATLDHRLVRAPGPRCRFLTPLDV